MTKETLVLDVALDALAHLLCSEREAGYFPVIHRVPTAAFDGFEPLFGDDDWILTGDHAGDQPVWPLDVCFAYPIGGSGGDDDWPEGTWQFQRYKTLKPKEWRGVIHRVFPRMVDSAWLVIRPNGESASARVPFALVGNRLIEVPRTTTGLRVDGAPGEFAVNRAWWGQRHQVEDDVHANTTARVVGGLALRRHYLWSVLLGEGNGPRARFVTDVPGMREVFRLRDIPPGRARRAALLHWVRQHWRRRRDPGANDRIWVREHLRGAWSYSWNGLLCQIEPSEDDLTRLGLADGQA